jgi:hypothetical protein
LIGMTYTFAVGLFSTSTTSVTNQVDTTTVRMDKAVTLIGVESCKYTGVNAWQINFTLKHAGTTYKINDATQNELTAMVDSTVFTGTATPSLGSTTLNPQDVKTFSLAYTNTSAFAGQHTLTIISPAGETPVRITC